MSLRLGGLQRISQLIISSSQAYISIRTRAYNSGVQMMLCGVGIFFTPFVSGMCNQEHLVGVFFLPKSDYCMTQLGGLPMMKNASGIHGWWSEW
jgi:hypothetical protein